MIFQKKIIIGSIMSFIATAIGVIAVFFPDLLNMQKEKINEYSVFLNNDKSIIDLATFLDKNVDKVIKLNISYCSVGRNGDVFSEVEKINDKISVYGKVEDGGTELPSSRTGGTIFIQTYSIKNDLLGDRLQLVVEDNENKRKSQSYYWTYDSAGYRDLNKPYLKYCSNNIYDGVPDMGELSGIFFLTYGEPLESTISYSLEPLSKADLKLKNY